MDRLLPGSSLTSALGLALTVALAPVGGHARTPAPPDAAAAPGALGADAGAPDSRGDTAAWLRALPSPPRAAELAVLGPKADHRLIAVVRDPAAEPAVRVRAMGALAHVSTRGARTFVEAFVRDHAHARGETERLLLRRAMVALGWAGGTAVPLRVGPLLDHPDAEVRLDAAVALSLSRLPEAVDLLRRRLAVEPDDRVRAHIERQLTPTSR